MPRPGPNVTSDADTQPGSDSLFPTGFSGGGALVRSGSVGTGEIADGSVASADLNLASVATALAARGEFTGTYASLNLPSGITGSGQYGTATNIYNLTAASTRKVRAKLAAAKAGTGICKVACVGESTTAGQGATRATTSYPAYLRGMLPSVGLTSSGTGLVPASPVPQDGRYAYAGSWNLFNSDVQMARANTTNSTLTFTSDVAGTVVEIKYLDSGNSFTYNIDGAGAVTVTTGATNQIKTVTVTGLANTTHTVVYTCTTNGNTFIYSTEVRAPSGVSISNFGQSSETTAKWTDQSNYFTLLNGVVAYAPDYTIIYEQLNDWGANVAISTYKANITTMVQQARLSGDVALVVSHQSGSASSGVWSQYQQALYDLSASLGAPLLDLTDRWGSYATANGLGLMFDVSHPNLTGYADQARAILGLLNL